MKTTLPKTQKASKTLSRWSYQMLLPFRSDWRDIQYHKDIHRPLLIRYSVAINVGLTHLVFPGDFRIFLKFFEENFSDEFEKVWLLFWKSLNIFLYGYTNVLSKYSNIWNNLWLKCQNMKYKYQWIKYISTHKQISTQMQIQNLATTQINNNNIYLRSKFNKHMHDADWFLDI